ncbi:hypothetical protein ACHHYP_14911 [Achlya hypogyna]|uniref:FYVE-type domain-containing protein n=1 Tax=Achlya hypogyna TaxID=1202772 RepID=A0A1V9YC26_ACHHY|nr:hypothetical protein ACHHYP_14911 [Achlya hypogyna]
MAMSSYNHIFVETLVDGDGDKPSRILRQDQLLLPHLYQPTKGCHACHECTKAFNTFRRKYNCQMCGHVVCKSCTLAHVAEVAKDVLDVKVCLSCVANLEAEHKLRRTQTTSSVRSSAELLRRRSSRSNVSLSRSSEDEHLMQLTIRGKETLVRRTSGSIDYSLDYSWKHKWPKPPTLPHEGDRLKVLRSFDLLHKDFTFEAICEIAAKVLQAPIVTVGFIDEHRHWFKSSMGLAQQNIPRAMSFCAHALASEEPLVVLDARLDKRFMHNPMVTGANIVFYASAPIIHASGHILGTVSVMDQKPRSSCDPSILETLASVVMKKLESAQGATNKARAKAASVSSSSERASGSHATGDELEADDLDEKALAPRDLVFTEKDLLHRSVWVSDAKRNNCFVCRSKFSMFLRKHHCRMCGEVVCKHCELSATVTMTSTDVDKVARVPVCLTCLSKKKAEKDAPEDAPAPASPKKRNIADSIMTVDEDDDDDAVPLLDRHMAFDVDMCEVVYTEKPLVLEPPPAAPELQRDISRTEIESMLAKLLSQSSDIQNQLSSQDQYR